MRLVLALLFPVFSLAAQPPPTPAPAEEVASPSTLALPIRVDLTPLLARVESQVPISPPVVETWAEIKGKPRTYFRFNLIREPLSIAIRGSQVSVRTVVNYGMDVGLRTIGEHYTVMGSCGRAPEPPRRAFLELKTGVSVLPNWKIDLQQAAFDVSPLNTCAITFLGYDITGQVTAGMKEQLAAGTDTLARLVRESALARQKAEEAWALFSQPIELRKDLYLLFQPRHIRLAPVTTQGRTLIITPEIEAQPRLVLGSKPETVASPLPDLELNASPRPGFHLRVETVVSYVHATTQLAAEVVGKVFDTPKGHFEITSARIWGDHDRAILEIGLKGRINGKVTLTGKPVPDPVTNALRLEGLDFTLDSRSWLAHMGDWIYHAELQKLLAEKARFLMDQQFQGLRETVQAGLNRPLAANLQLSGTLKALRVGPVTTGPEGFLSQAELEGEVQVDIK
jgi:hypothetical protein